ncbi:YqzE family protein [Terrilactibacillus laevilacticus]|uniref:YqzE family protein n=1 Tax=Terrilactibacillus laevilacticus TaxID=1380157 RepID=A0ABW5PUA9_9BACI|nr:YqzE family protein [Terrilactibacillus laevilacticus]
MKSDEYVRFLTEQFVQHMEKPKSVRKSIKEEKKQYKASKREQWFGLLPFAFSHYVKGAKKKLSKKTK